MSLTYLNNVVTLKLDQDKCIGCGDCLEVCPHAVFELQDNKSHLAYQDHCMECGACALNCPTGAISVEAGVGCATAIIYGWLKGTEPTCDCSEPETKSKKKNTKDSCCCG